MNEVKTLGIEFLASASSFHDIAVAFPSLEVLEFDDMQGWERWSTRGGDDDRPATLLPRLHRISIKNCPKLNQVFVDIVPSLQVLHIEECSEEVLRSIVGVSSSIVRLTMNDIKGLVQLHQDVLKYLGVVEELITISCDELKYLWECESEACKFLVSLKKLTVSNCGTLVSLGEREDHSWISLMSSVTNVTLGACQRLESFRCPNNIETLWIKECGSMTSLTFPTMQDLPSTVKRIHIEDCKNLEESWFLNNFLSSLESLFIRRFYKVRSFPEGYFVHLTKLKIWNCDKIESIPEKGFGFLPLFCLKSLSITDCKNLKLFPHVHFPILKSLEDLEIKNRPSMDDSFPCGLWPPNLRKLETGCLNKPMSQWGLLNFPTSLVQLDLNGVNSGVVSFAEADGVRNNTTSSSMFLCLPPSLTSLFLIDFEELESVSMGLQHLTCLEKLWIYSCPKLRDLPEKLLPSLSDLTVFNCKNKKLEKKCRSGTGKYWPIISQMPSFLYSR